MNKYQNSLMEDLAQTIASDLKPLKENSLIERFLRDVASQAAEDGDLTEDTARRAVRDAVVSLVEDNVLSTLSPTSSRSLQASWINTAIDHGIFGRTMRAAGLV